MCLFQVSYAIVLFRYFIRECEQYYDIMLVVLFVNVDHLTLQRKLGGLF
jgi:hypothetical protein